MVRSGRITGSRSGASAAEFALLLPVLLLMLIGTIQYGTLMFTYNTMLNAARNGARSAALGTATAGDVQGLVRAMMPGWVPANQVMVSTSDVAGNAIQVDVSVPGADASIIDLGPMPSTIDARITMVREG